MSRTAVFAPLSCGKVATIFRCTLPDLVHLKRLEENMATMTIEDILLGGSPELDTLFSSCVRLPDGVEKLEIDSDDVCEIADKFREVNSRFLSRLQALNTLLTLGEVFQEGTDPRAGASDLMHRILEEQLQVAVP